MTPAVRIQAWSPRGHCRAGVRHPATAVLHPPGTFTAEQIDTLRDDPRLLVEIVGDLAMGSLTGPEIATVMADAFQEGTVLTGWEAHPVSPPPPDDGEPPTPDPVASASEAPTDSETTDPVPPDEPAARPARARKAKEA